MAGSEMKVIYEVVKNSRKEKKDVVYQEFKSVGHYESVHIIKTS
jgi:hypothetical protein